jgi:negative regulator of sigma E activity
LIELKSTQFKFRLQLFRMKAFVTGIVFVGLIALASCEATAEEKRIFREWRKKHNKKYASLEEELERLEIFLENKEEIEMHNRLYEEGLFELSLFVSVQ